MCVCGFFFTSNNIVNIFLPVLDSSRYKEDRMSKYQFSVAKSFSLIKELKFYLCGLHINISICVICKSMLKISLLFLLSDLTLIQSLLVIYISSLVHFNECVPNACRLLDICTIYKYYKYSL